MTLAELVHLNYENLNTGDLEIWEKIFNHKAEFAECTIEQCAELCNVSRTTILRFAKKLNLSGYAEFRYRLRREAASEAQEPESESGVDVPQLTELFSNLVKNDLPGRDYRAFNRMMDEARRVFIIPSGHTQSVAVMELQNLITVYTAKTIVVADSRSRRTAMLNTVQPQDLAIFVSMSGQNEMLLGIARELKWRHVPIIAFTQFWSNPMADLADLPIRYPVQTYQGGGGRSYTSIGSLYVVIEFYLAHYFNHVNGIEESEPDDGKRD